MTTIKLSGGSLGREIMYVRTDLGRSESPVQVNYVADGESKWEPTPYQCADTRHSKSGLIEIGRELAARTCEVAAADFDCRAEEVEG